MVWHFEKIPKTEHAGFLEAFQISDFKTIIILCNKYNVLPLTLCHSCGLKEIVENVTKAVEHKIISL